MESVEVMTLGGNTPSHRTHVGEKLVWAVNEDGSLDLWEEMPPTNHRSSAFRRVVVTYANGAWESILRGRTVV